MKSVVDFFRECYGTVAKNKTFTVQELMEFADKYAKEYTSIKLSRAIAMQFQISEAEMFTKCRKRELVNARQVYVTLLKDCTKATLPMLAAESGLDHATVMYSWKVVANFWDLERGFRDKYTKLKWMVYADKVTLPWIGIKKEIDFNARPNTESSYNMHQKMPNGVLLGLSEEVAV